MHDLSPCTPSISHSNRLFPDSLGLPKADCLNLVKKSEMLLLQRLEVVVQLLVPRIENKDLERQGRGCHGKVGQGYSSGDDHGGKDSDKYRHTCELC